MSTDDTGSWARPNPIDRTDPEFVDTTRLAPTEPSADDAPDESQSDGAPDAVEIADADLVAVDVDDVNTDDVADEDIAQIMAGFEQRSSESSPSDGAETPAPDAPEGETPAPAASDQNDVDGDAADPAQDSGDAPSTSDKETAEVEAPAPVEPEKPAEPEKPVGFATLGLRPELVQTLNDLTTKSRRPSSARPFRFF